METWNHHGKKSDGGTEPPHRRRKTNLRSGRLQLPSAESQTDHDDEWPVKGWQSRPSEPVTQEEEAVLWGRADGDLANENEDDGTG